VPFAKASAERQTSGDPRKSLQERDADHVGFVSAVADAARALVKERVLLQEDADRVIGVAKASDVLKGASTPTSSSR
jgi:hypothetical protein